MGTAGVALTYLRLHECLKRAPPGSPQWAGESTPGLASSYLEAASGLVHSTRRNLVCQA